MNRGKIVLAAALAAVVLVVAAGLWVRTRGGDSAKNDADVGRSVAPGAPLAQQCPTYSGSAERVSFPGDGGTTIYGSLTGPKTAKTAVVIRNGASSTICQWLPWADRISAESGARVLLFDRRGTGGTGGVANTGAEAADTAAAAAYLNEGQQVRIALVGASMGSTAVQDSVSLLPSPPCATVLVSPVVPALKALPVNTWITWETQGENVNMVATSLTQRAPAGSPAHTLPVATRHHSGQLVREHPEVLPFITDAVKSCTTG